MVLPSERMMNRMSCSKYEVFSLKAPEVQDASCTAKSLASVEQHEVPGAWKDINIIHQTTVQSHEWLLDGHYSGHL